MFAAEDMMAQLPALVACCKGSNASPAIMDSPFGTVSQKYFLLHAAFGYGILL